MYEAEEPHVSSKVVSETLNVVVLNKWRLFTFTGFNLHQNYE